MSSMNGHNAAELFQGQALLYKHIFSFLSPMCLKWAIELGIADIIHNHGKPITLPELVSALQVPPAKACHVLRFMRFLAHNGIFAIERIHDKEEQEEKEAYVLTPASKLLVKGTNHCLSPFAKFVIDPVMISVQLQMRNWTYTEQQTIFETAFGARWWDFLHNNPKDMDVFNEGMASDCQILNFALRDCNSVFEGLDSIVDVGGGTGATGKIICEAFPMLKYIVFDLPQVVANLSSESDNLSYVGGDMFKSIPEADAILLKWVLHNWSDDDCKKILKNCKNAISRKGNGGKVIIIDIVMDENQDKNEMTQTKLLLDITMMTISGKERDEKEWKQLFVEAGFKHYKIFPIFGFRSLIEVYF